MKRNRFSKGVSCLQSSEVSLCLWDKGFIYSEEAWTHIVLALLKVLFLVLQMIDLRQREINGGAFIPFRRILYFVLHLKVPISQVLLVLIPFSILFLDIFEFLDRIFNCFLFFITGYFSNWIVSKRSNWSNWIFNWGLCLIFVSSPNSIKCARCVYFRLPIMFKAVIVIENSIIVSLLSCPAKVHRSISK